MMCKNKQFEQPTVLPIKRIIDESKDFRTFVFDYDLQATPGQFIMLWIPRVDAKPFAVSHQKDGEFHVAVLAVGPFTKQLMTMKEGDKLGFFGPYGNPFELKGKKVAMIGGGSGTPPLKYLAYEAAAQGIEVDFIWGARNAEYVPYAKELESAPFNTFITTDDGSLGSKGFTTEVLKERLASEKYDCLYTCGPEIMMKKIMDMSDEHKVPCQVSMERYMKCGFGVCGQCSVDGEGVPLCTKGPVFEKETVKNITEFMAYHRDAKGEKVYSHGQEEQRRD